MMPPAYLFDTGAHRTAQTTLLKPEYSARSFITARAKKARFHADSTAAEHAADLEYSLSGSVSNMGLPGKNKGGKAQSSAQEAPKKNAPVETFRAGGMKATIWENIKADDEGTYYSVALVRSYKDKAGAWQETNSLRSHDIAKAILVLNKAFEYINLADNSVE